MWKYRLHPGAKLSKLDFILNWEWRGPCAKEHCERIQGTRAVELVRKQGSHPGKKEEDSVGRRSVPR